MATADSREDVVVVPGDAGVGMDGPLCVTHLKSTSHGVGIAVSGRGGDIRRRLT